MARGSLVLVSHLRELLGVREAAVVERAGGLVDSGLLAPGPQLRYQAGYFRITRAGLEAIGSRLSEPGIDLRGYWREIAAGLAVDQGSLRGAWLGRADLHQAGDASRR